MYTTVHVCNPGCILFSHYTKKHDDFNTVKVCHSANPTQVGFVHIYESCILVTLNAFLRHVPLGFSTWH